MNLSSLPNNNKKLFKILTTKKNLTDNEKKILKNITNSIYKKAGPEIYEKLVQLNKNKRLLESTKKMRKKKTKKLKLKRGVGRSIKNRLINSISFSRGRRLIKKKVIFSDKITNNEIKHPFDDDIEYIFIDYDNLVKYLGKYTDFYIILNNLVNILSANEKKVILITSKDVVKSYGTSELFTTPSFTYDNTRSTTSSINKCMLISIAGSDEEEMNLQNFKNQLIAKNIINKYIIPSAISINNLSGLKILFNLIAKIETSKPKFIIEFGDDRLSRQQKYYNIFKLKIKEVISLKKHGEINHSKYKKGVNVVLFEVKDMNEGNPFEKKVLSKSMLFNNLEYVNTKNIDKKIRHGFTTKSNNLQYSLAFYLSLEEYKYYLLPNIDTNYNGIVDYQQYVNRDRIHKQHNSTKKALKKAKKNAKAVGSNSTPSNSTKIPRKKSRTTNRIKFIEGTKKVKTYSEVIKNPKERVVNNQLEELNLTRPVYLNNNFSEPLYGRSVKKIIKPTYGPSIEKHDFYNLYTSKNKQGNPEYTGIKRERLQKFNLNKAIKDTINNRYKSSASSVPIEQLKREAINTIKQRIQQDRSTNNSIQNINTISSLNRYINELINNDVRLQNIHLPKK